MSDSFKKVFLSAVVGMLVYAVVYEVFRYLNWVGDNSLETILIRVVVPLVISIMISFIVLGLVIKVNKAK